jgi:hypothetical protein
VLTRDRGSFVFGRCKSRDGLVGRVQSDTRAGRAAPGPARGVCTHSARSAAPRSTIIRGGCRAAGDAPPLAAGPLVASRGHGGPCRRGDRRPGLSWARPTRYGRRRPARPAQGSITPRYGRAPACIAASWGSERSFVFGTRGSPGGLAWGMRARRGRGRQRYGTGGAGALTQRALRLPER